MMKVKTVQYIIEEPCHEDWAKMKPEAKGRFCEACSKTVVDFSVMSDFSIVNYMTEKKDESVCGRFRPEQMEKTYSLSVPHRSFSFDLKAVALGLALTTFSAIHVNAQVTPVDTTQVIHQEPLDGMVSVIERYDHTNERFTSGVLLLHGEPYKFVKVILMDEQGKEIAASLVDSNGKFRILLDWSKKPYKLMIDGPGLRPDVYFLDYYKSITNWEITVREEEPIYMGFVCPKPAIKSSTKP